MKELRLHRHQQGIALGYVFGLVALLAVLGAMLANGSGVRHSAIEQKRVADQLVSQGQLIRNALFLCHITYPAGGASGGVDNSFPADTGDLANVTCPGSDSGMGTERVFGQVSSVMYPRKPDGFIDWQLTNDNSGVSISTTMESASDVNMQEAMKLAQGELGEWQVTLSGATFTYHITN